MAGTTIEARIGAEALTRMSWGRASVENRRTTGDVSGVGASGPGCTEYRQVGTLLALLLFEASDEDHED